MITENWTELVPAYGRDYKNKTAIEHDFRAGKDFQLTSITHGGRYCSINDFAKGTQVILRYARLTKTCCVTV